MTHIANATTVHDLVRTLRTIGYRPSDGPERRAQPRYAISLPVDVQPLNADHHPCGPARRVVTRDISEQGIGLLSDRPIETQYLRIEIPTPSGEPVEALVEVLRCRRHAFLYDIGGRFVTDSDTSN